MSKIFDKMFEMDDSDIVGKTYIMKVACEGAICDECDTKKIEKRSSLWMMRLMKRLQKLNRGIN